MLMMMARQTRHMNTVAILVMTMDALSKNLCNLSITASPTLNRHGPEMPIGLSPAMPQDFIRRNCETLI
jgi:hypothetical protein